uniref:Putative copper ion binding protein n=1 Tax=mine drainage metagenome TaxID=410659 RepID=E6QTM5_9ZZZZ
METIVLSVSGMTCGGCVNSVQRVLKALPGVAEVSVSLDTAEAKINYDPAKTTRALMIEKVNKAGFKAV